MKKTLSILIIVLALGWVALDYTIERTVATTNELIQDEIHTDWVKCAKECDSIPTLTIVLTADTTNTVDGNAVR